MQQEHSSAINPHIESRTQRDRYGHEVSLVFLGFREDLAAVSDYDPTSPLRVVHYTPATFRKQRATLYRKEGIALRFWSIEPNDESHPCQMCLGPCEISWNRGELISVKIPKEITIPRKEFSNLTEMDFDGFILLVLPHLLMNPEVWGRPSIAERNASL